MKLEVINPANLEVIETLPVPENSEIDGILESSRKAHDLWKEKS